MTDEYATEPDEAPEVAETEADDADVEDQNAAEASDDENEDQEEASEDDADPGEPEFVELEIDGVTRKIPADLKDAVMRHADYTRKTQEVAEQRKAFEAEREAAAEQRKVEAEVGERFQDLQALDRELKEFRSLDWMKLQSEDPNLANQMLFRFNALKDQRDETAREVDGKISEARAKMERQRADHVAKNNARIAAEIPDWNDAKAAEVKTFGKSLGFGDREIETALGNDWKIAKVLDLAMLGQRVLEQRKAPKKQRPAESSNVEPLPKMKGRASPKSGPTDRQSAAEWMKAREKQLRSG